MVLCMGYLRYLLDRYVVTTYYLLLSLYVEAYSVTYSITSHGDLLHSILNTRWRVGWRNRVHTE